MFKKFDPKENKNNITLMKTSVAKKFRRGAREQYPLLEEVIDEIWPNKSAKQQLRTGWSIFFGRIETRKPLSYFFTVQPFLH